MQANFYIKNVKSSVTTGLKRLCLPCGDSVGIITRLYKKDAWKDEKAKHFKYRIVFNCKEGQKPSENIMHGRCLHFNSLDEVGDQFKSIIDNCYN